MALYCIYAFISNGVLPYLHSIHELDEADKLMSLIYYRLIDAITHQWCKTTWGHTVTWLARFHGPTRKRLMDKQGCEMGLWNSLANGALVLTDDHPNHD